MTLLSHSQPANDVGLDLDALEEVLRRVKEIIETRDWRQELA